MRNKQVRNLSLIPLDGRGVPGLGTGGRRCAPAGPQPISRSPQ